MLARRVVSRQGAVALVVVGVLVGRAAHATSVEEFPDNGSEQEGRGGAWVARASDPLAAFYNPAGLAGQATRLTLQANFAVQSRCFTRVKALGDSTQDGVAPGGTYPRVCSENANALHPFVDPQLGFTWRLTDRIGLGLLLLGPSAVGATTWPEFVDGRAAPQRYLLLRSNVVFFTPTIGVGWEALPGLRVGASFQAGIAPQVDFVHATAATNAPNESPGADDIRAELKASSWFVPGFTLGSIWSPGDSIDVAGWYRWSAPIIARGDVTTAGNYFTSQVAKTPADTSGVTYGDTSKGDCGNPAFTTSKPCGNGNNARLKVPIPMEAKIGARYHRPRRGRRPGAEHRRDPIAHDVFDVEIDFTWANDSAVDSLELAFPSDANGNGTIPANPGIPEGKLPPNADVRYHFRDVFGVRIGGDYNVLPDRLAVRAGGFFETSAADPTYQNIDFDGADRVGLAAGATYRIALGSHAIDVMAAYGHVFFGTLGNSNPASPGLPGLTGTACNPASTASGSTCPDGNLKYRTNWPVNLGTITSSIDVLNIGASYRF